MSQARSAIANALRGRTLSFLLVLALAVIWQNGDGARSQQPPRDEAGSLSLTIHPDEGVRQIAQFFQKRGADERKSGALPDPVLLLAQGPRPQPQGRPHSRPAEAGLRLPAPPRATRLARAPPPTLPI